MYIIDPNVKGKTVKFLEARRRINVGTKSSNNKNIDKLDFIKIKIRTCISKDNIKIGKEKTLSARRYFPYIYMRKDSSIIYKELLPTKKEKKDNIISKICNKLEQTFYQREYSNDQYSYKDLLGITDQRSTN